MPLLYIILLVGLGFALVVVLLLLAYLCNVSNCVDSPSGASSSRSIEADEEEGNSFIQSGSNNNNNNVRSNSVQLQSEFTPNHGLSSRPSAPLLNEATQSRAEISRATSRQSVSSQNVIEDMRAIQTSLVRNDLVRRSSSRDNESNFNLIIVVDAQSENFGGFCVSFGSDEENNWVDFYSIMRDDLPWRFGHDFDDMAELDAKNFLFALMLWSDVIVETKRILVYIGNHAVVYDNNKYGRRATKLLEHYSQCEGVVIGNDCRYLVTHKKDPKSFAEHILPAKDLSSGNLREFHDFVSKYYEVGLENFKGSHYIPPFKPRNEQEVGFEKIEQNYNNYIAKVRDAMKTWIEPCSKCGYVDDETASMLSINRIPP